MIEIFQYCRMLLKPEGTLALLLPDNVKQPWWNFLSAWVPFIRATGRKSISVSLLKKAGLAGERQIPFKMFGKIVICHRRSVYRRKYTY